MSQNTLSLKVLEAYTRDVGRGVARIDYDSMDSLTASTGDVIEIRGKRRTVAKCLPLYPSDEGKGIVRVDGLVRNNAGVAIGDTVIVKPWEFESDKRGDLLFKYTPAAIEWLKRKGFIKEVENEF